MSANIQAVILGATGYVGGELLRLISTHPNLQLAAAVSESRAGDAIPAAFPHLSAIYGDSKFESHEACLNTADAGSKLAVFSAAPHGASATIIKKLLDAAATKDMDVHVVDSSADFRYAAQAAFESVRMPNTDWRNRPVSYTAVSVVGDPAAG